MVFTLEKGGFFLVTKFKGRFLHSSSGIVAKELVRLIFSIRRGCHFYIYPVALAEPVRDL